MLYHQLVSDHVRIWLIATLKRSPTTTKAISSMG